MSQGTPPPAPQAPASPSAESASSRAQASKEELLSSRVEALYNNGVARARRRRTQEGLSPAELGCSFNPHLVTKRSGVHSAEGGAYPRVHGSSDGDPRSPQSFASEGSTRFEVLYASAADRRERLEVTRRRLLAQETPSFRPNLETVKFKSKAEEAGDASDRFEVLYAKAMEQRENLLQKQKELHDSECTFRPKLEAKSWSASKVVGQKRLDELYTEAQRIEERRCQEEKKLANQHSFTPHINTKRSSRRNIAFLCPDRSQMIARDAKLKEAKLSNELKECTFTPNLTSSNKKKSPTSPNWESLESEGVHSRLYEHAKQKMKRDKEATKVTSPTRKASTGRANLEVFDRLYREGVEWKNKRGEDARRALERYEEEKQRKIAKECTFTPKLPENSQALAERARKRESEKLANQPLSPETAGNIFTRLHKESLEKSLRKDDLDPMGLQFDHTFQPTISPASKAIAEKKLRREQAERSRKEPIWDAENDAPNLKEEATDENQERDENIEDLRRMIESDMLKTGYVRQRIDSWEKN